MKWNIFKRNSKTLEIEMMMNLKSADIKINNFLFEHGKWLIADCIAKSEICTVIDKKNVKEDMYYLLNVRPNPNQTATEFWLSVIDKYFSYKGEVLIVEVAGNLYIADTYTKSNDILTGQTFTNVTISIDGNSLKLYKTFDASVSMLIRRVDKMIDYYLESTNDKISDLMIAAMSGYKRKTPKFKLNIPNGVPLMTADQKPITTNEYTKQISDEMSNNQTTVIRLPKQIELESIKNECNVTTEEFKSLFHQAATNVAMALNIPINALLGNITEKSDAIDEMITFAVSATVENINDSFNYCLMSKKSFLNGSKIFFDLSNCKHRDILSNATGIDKLVGVGFSHNNILSFFGKPEIDEDWANEHNITKNYGKIGENPKGGDEE